MQADVKELSRIVAAAKDAVGDLDDEQLRRVAFERVLQHLLTDGHQESIVTETERSVPVPVPVAAAADVADGAFAGEQQRVDAVARYFKIEPEEVPHLFDLSENEPSLVVHTSQLARPKSEATKEIVLLIAGVRTALGQDTTTAHIRSVADQFGKFDSANFMKTLGRLQHVSVLGKPGSTNRLVRMKVPGAENAQELAQRLVGS